MRLLKKFFSGITILALSFVLTCSIAMAGSMSIPAKEHPHYSYSFSQKLTQKKHHHNHCRLCITSHDTQIHLRDTHISKNFQKGEKSAYSIYTEDIKCTIDQNFHPLPFLQHTAGPPPDILFQHLLL